MTPPVVDLVLFNAVVVDAHGWAGAAGYGVAIDKGKILAVGNRADIEPYVPTARRRVDLAGRIVIPGLVNSHCHCADSLFRGLIEDLPLEQWLASLWKAEAAVLTPQTVALGARIGLAELLLGGVTTVADMFWFPRETARVAGEIGIRYVGGPVFVDGPGIDGLNGIAARVAEVDVFVGEFEHHRSVHPAVMPHSTYTNDRSMFEAAVDAARRHGLPLLTHAAETRTEQQIVEVRYGLRVVELLHAMGALGPDVTLAHGVHLSATEVDLLATSGTHVAHNPLSNLKLGAGIADVSTLTARGINVALGTDGPVSGNDLDLWIAMRLAALLQRGVRQDATQIGALKAFAMATSGGARALGLQHRIGALAPGLDADLVVLDVDRPHAWPIYDPVSHIVFSAGRSDVRDVYVAGRQVVAERQLVQCDLGEAFAALSKLRPSIAATVHLSGDEAPQP